MFYSIKNLGSVVLDIDGSRLDAVFISETGAVLDNFTMINGADVTRPRRPVRGIGRRAD